MRSVLSKLFLASLTVGLISAMAVAPASAEHVQCGDTITQSTTLDSDLVCPGDALRIGADDVTLDLAGHEIRGPGTASGAVAVHNQGFNDMTVTNGRITDYSTAVRAKDSTRGHISDLTLNTVVVSLQRADGYVVWRNVLSAGSIFLQDADSNLVRNNRLDEGRIQIIQGQHNVLDRNRVSVPTTSATFAISIVGAHHTVVSRNKVQGGGFSGIEVFASSTNTVVERNVVSGAGVGIWLSSAGQSTISNNHVSDSTEDGIRVAFSRDTILEGNLSRRNGDDGIDVDSVPTTVTRNTANRNGDLGIEAVPGVIDGGGNKAHGNGNPAQCVNVSCK
jgi:parallel beta-helix repeat protein